VVNILSFHLVAKHYDVWYDSTVADEFHVEILGGQLVRFAPTAKGLYVCTGPRQEDSTGWAFINLVDNRKQEYTRRQYRDAVQARRIQNIIMFPKTHSYGKIVESNMLPNCPISKEDIAVAEQLFGPNVGALKGKTVYQAGVPVHGRIEGVPPSLRDRLQNMVMAIDIMFVNKIPFLVTCGQGVRFGTIENLKNQQVTTVASALDTVIHLYHQWGLVVGTINADGKFEPLQEVLTSVSFNLCAKEEHVPEIERYIRTVKDRMHSGYNSLPFERIPCMMVIHLAANAVFWLNAFPHPDGMSNTLSLCYLLTGQPLDYRKHVCLEFGAYVQTHEEHTNGMEARTVGAICLGPMGNEQGGHYFMSLSTGAASHKIDGRSCPCRMML
jgi:hypothetical protein